MKKPLFAAVCIAVAAALFAVPGASAYDWQSALGSLGVSKNTSLDSTQVGRGLKEALRVGIDKTVALTGKKDGYFANEAIKILMPEKLRAMDGLLRKVGLGPQMDDFVLSMNRAAESAAPYARDIFVDAVGKMTIADAEALMKGGDTAITDYFRKTTSNQLMQAYKPVVAKTMSQYAVTGKYQALAAKYQSIPFASKLPLPSIEDYTAAKSVDGLFTVLGQQEKDIRQNPAARTTDLLKQVFTSKG